MSERRPTPDERRFRALASSSAERIAELDSFGRTIYTSPSHARQGDDALASLDHVHPDDRGEVSERFAACYGDGQPRRVTFRVLDPNGPMRWVECALTPFQAEDGRHVLVVSRDVTGAQHAEQHLRESRERFQLIAENAYDMIAEQDVRGQLLYTNDRVWRVLGYQDGERPSDGVRLVHPEDLEAAKGALRSVRDGVTESSQQTFRARHADGSWCWVDAIVRRLVRPDGEVRMLVIARDVTERVEAEQRLRESEERYRELVEEAPVGIVVVQGDGIVYANQATARIAGARNPEEIAGTSFFGFLDEEETRKVAAILARGNQGLGVPRTVDVTIQTLQGERRNVHATISVITYRGAPAFQAIVHDVTEIERNRRERERLELQLQEARKLESLGVLAGGIAHDFNNLLAVILSSVRYAQAPESDQAGRREALRDAEEAANGAARLVKQLLAYAGRRSPEVGEVDLSELAASLVDLLGTAVPGGVELLFELTKEPLPVHADLVQLEQVLMNLVLNAAHAVGEGLGFVRVRTRRRRVGRNELVGWLGGEDLSEGDYACLEVEDSGAGMDAETQARMFDPFFTTKETGHGLGLSAVLGLVRGHRGAIDVRSAPGEGTALCVALPTASLAPRRVRARARQPLVLLADADDGRRRACAAGLGEDGLEVLEAEDASQVLDLWALYGDEVDVAVLGADPADPESPPLASALRASRPALPILALCAADADADADPRLATADARLVAPFEPAALREMVARLLEKPTA